ncbi:DNA-binding protein [uncultured Dialister sp.]|uniref:DNA-binding protein n=1 Tax=Dialister hominis TaxID=2582419 RepID=UPI0026DD6DDB|nr:DNA-binding protein [uncultured Dialister sp.]
MKNEEWKNAEMLNAKDVAEILNVPVSRGYTIIRQLNRELKAKGKLVLRGRINRAFFESKIMP